MILRNRLFLAAIAATSAYAFVPLTPARQSVSRSLQRTLIPPAISKPSHPSTRLYMSDDFNEGKYTEAAWSAISAIPRAGDYHQVTAIEAPILLDVLLNPSKHGTSNDGTEAAQKVVEKVLTKAGLPSINDLRAKLETYLGKQA